MILEAQSYQERGWAILSLFIFLFSLEGAFHFLENLGFDTYFFLLNKDTLNSFVIYWPLILSSLIKAWPSFLLFSLFSIYWIRTRSNHFRRCGLSFEPSSLISDSLLLNSICLLFFQSSKLRLSIYLFKEGLINYCFNHEFCFAVVIGSWYSVSFIFYSRVLCLAFSLSSADHCWSVFQCQTGSSLREKKIQNWSRFSVRF